MVQAQEGGADLNALEQKVNSLCERYEGNMSDYTIARGSSMATFEPQLGSLAHLTQWKLVLPLEYKMHILAMTMKERDNKNKQNNGGSDQMQVDLTDNKFSELV